MPQLTRLAAAGVAITLILAAGCGSSGPADPAPETTSTTEDPDEATLRQFEAGARAGIDEFLLAQGATQEQSTCVADTLIDEYGLEALADGDQEAYRASIIACGLDPDGFEDQS